MGIVLRLWVPAIAVQIYACFVLLLGVAGQPAMREFTEFLPAVLRYCAALALFVWPDSCPSGQEAELNNQFLLKRT